MKIVLTNKTRYFSTDIKRIVRAACKAAGVALGKVYVTLIYSRCGQVTGYAYFPPNVSRAELAKHFGEMVLRIPKPQKMTGGPSFAQVALHEAMHVAGARHADMTREQYNCSMPTPWADGMQLRFSAESTKKTDVHITDRVVHAQKMLARAQTRLKRAATLEKKWRLKLGRLERKLSNVA